MSMDPFLACKKTVCANARARSQSPAAGVVAIPAASGLAAVVAGLDHLPQKRSWQKSLAVGLMQDFVDALRQRVGRIVEKLEGSDRMAEPELASCVDIGGRTDA